MDEDTRIESNGPTVENRSSLTSLEERFCLAYATKGSDTYGVGATSAVAAGYRGKNQNQIAYQLLKKDRIRARIEEIRANPAPQPSTAIDQSALVALLQKNLAAADAKGDYSTAARTIELLGKASGVLDTANQMPDAVRKEYDERERELMRAFADWYTGYSQQVDADAEAGPAQEPAGSGMAAGPQQQAGQAGDVPEGDGARPAEGDLPTTPPLPDKG